MCSSDLWVERQGDGNATGPPDAPLHRNPGQSRRQKKRHTLFSKVLVAGEQLGRHARRGIQQIVVGKRSLRIGDRDASAVPLGLSD